jgi:hypothetical protein
MGASTVLAAALPPVQGMRTFAVPNTRVSPASFVTVRSIST